MRENATLLEIEFDRFVRENPCADSIEIAAHFFNLGVEKERERVKEEKEREVKLPPYYGG